LPSLLLLLLVLLVLLLLLLPWQMGNGTDLACGYHTAVACGCYKHSA
jgi:hypothetical protein